MFAVVGGGISGLALAYGLAQRGKEVVLLESADRVGGALRSWSRDGFLLEASANSFVDREPHTHALLARLGLAAQPAAPAAKQRFLVSRGALAALPGAPPALVRSPLLTPWGKLRLLAEPLSRRGDGGDEPLARFARRHLGEEATSVLVDAMQTGIYAGDIERLSAEATFPTWVELERAYRSLLWGALRTRREPRGRGPVCSFEQGMGALPHTLADALGERVQTQATVRELVRAGTRWVVRYERRGEPSSLIAEHVAVATPAPTAAALLRPHDPVLAEHLEDIPYAPIAVVHLAYDAAAFPAAPNGFGFLVPAREQRPLLGCIFASSTFPWRAPADAVLLTCLLGGARSPDLVRAPPRPLEQLAEDEVKALLGARRPPRWTETVTWPLGIPQYEVGHRDRLSAIDQRLDALGGLSLLGNAYRGVGVTDCVRHAAALTERLCAPAT